jgi:hypothetical protein
MSTTYSSDAGPAAILSVHNIKQQRDVFFETPEAVEKNVNSGWISSYTSHIISNSVAGREATGHLLLLRTPGKAESEKIIFKKMA